MPRIYDNGVLIADIPDPVPQIITLAQAREALAEAGLLDVADAEVRAAGGKALRFWEYSNGISRGSPTVAAMAAGLKLTEAQVDALFIRAAQIEA